MKAENIDFIQDNFYFKNPSKNDFKFIIFKSAKNIDILALYYTTPEYLGLKGAETFICLYDLKTKEKKIEYNSKGVVRKLEHYLLNNQDLLINIHEYNQIIIYSIEKEEPIKIIDSPAERSTEDFFGGYSYKMYFCPCFILDGKINLITSNYLDKCIKLWDFDSCKLLKRVENFKYTYCIKVFTDKNNNYLIATNKNLACYTLPDFQLFKKYYEFYDDDKRNFIIDKIQNKPFIFAFESGTLKIFDFFSGNLFKNIEFQFEFSLEMSNIILWDDENIICCHDDSLQLHSGTSFISRINSKRASLAPFKGFSFVKYEFNNNKYLFYNDDQKCIKALKISESD